MNHDDAGRLKFLSTKLMPHLGSALEKYIFKYNCALDADLPGSCTSLNCTSLNLKLPVELRFSMSSGS